MATTRAALSKIRMTRRSRGAGGASVSVATLMALLPAPAANAVPLPANCLQADRTVACTFTFNGDERTHDNAAEQLFVVPDGVEVLTVTATGAAGGNTASGVGAVADASLAVTPNSTLYVEVGGPGDVGGSSNKGGFN